MIWNIVSRLRPTRRPYRGAHDEKALLRKRDELQRAVSETYRHAVTQSGLSTRQIAAAIGTSGDSSVIRITRPEGANVSLDTMSDIAHAIGKRVVVVLLDE